MRNPMVSIVIPVYNGANYLREAIDSALAQTYDNFEIVVVNDGSNDDGATEAIALSYGDKIRYFSKENGGVSTALNLAIRNMKGEYFSWLSHDDLYYPNKLKAQIEALKAGGDMHAIAFSDHDTLDMETGEKELSNFKKGCSTQQLTTSVFALLYAGVQGCELLIHKSYFERFGTFDEDLRAVQDTDLWFKMFRESPIVYVPEPLICIRVHSNQHGVKIAPRFKRESAEFFLKVTRSLSKGELEKMFGNQNTFYHYVAGKVFSKNQPDLFLEAVRFFNSSNEEATEDTKMRRTEFDAWFDELRGPCSKICIFGPGENGRQLLFALEGRGIKVDYFATNSAKRWGTTIDGISCISPDELQKIRDDTLVLVALHIENEVLKQLEEMGCQYYTTKRTMDGQLLKSVPYKIPEYALMQI